MSSRFLRVVIVAFLVLLAGCAGPLSSTPGTAADGPSTSSGSGTLSFFVSDQPAAIDDFEHLNVTISAIGVHRVDNESTDTDEDESEVSETEASDEDDDAGEWIERTVDNRTVDLTELRGANASLIDRFEVPNGTYGNVFVHVSTVNGVLHNGEQVTVKLPSEKLQIHERFTVENGTEVDFVFDIAVHKAGNSGKYILRPVISESGTDVPIDPIDDERDREDALEATFIGDVAQGGNATVEVTLEGEPVGNATVYVNDDRVGTTGTEGRVAFAVPDASELTVEVEYGDAEAELERFDESEDEPDTDSLGPPPTPDT